MSNPRRRRAVATSWLAGDVFLNLDFKYLRVDTGADTDLGKTDLTVNRYIPGGGPGYRF